jgi:hypothetical protein
VRLKALSAEGVMRVSCVPKFPFLNLDRLQCILEVYGFTGFLSHSMQIPGFCFEIGHDHFLSNPSTSPFVILPSYLSTVSTLSVWYVDAK